mmetsp:Transcript_94203/g.237529  ORF Transcript_94203/g.237529 Transcript_94203/m.237529 type:complete len:170 (+) Transcript_94203:797-1306(+)
MSSVSSLCSTTARVQPRCRARGRRSAGSWTATLSTRLSRRQHRRSVTATMRSSQRCPCLAPWMPMSARSWPMHLSASRSRGAQQSCRRARLAKKFYIIEEGQAEAFKNGTKVMDFSVGDYFGELALITDQPRAATVSAKGPCKLLSVDSRSFKRLLNVTDLLERTNRYK